MKVPVDVRMARPMGDNMLTGRDSFERFCELLNKDLQHHPLRPEGGVGMEPADLELEAVRDAWRSFFVDHYTKLTHYFRNVFAILRFVDERAQENEKGQYVQILRAQLSVYEFKLLFYNGLQEGTANFKAFAEKYALFDNIGVIPYAKEVSARISRNHYQLYRRGAYGTWVPPEPSYDRETWVDESDLRDADE
jgi:hypothetical protein